AVVDPGVGGLRKSIIIKTNGYYYVGPDNGAFTPFLEGADAIYRIHEDKAGLPNRSKTFDGRDLFAPVAARLAAGADPLELAEATQQVARLHIPRPRREGKTLVGQVLYNDHFGNLITNIHARDLSPYGNELEVWVGGRRASVFSETYEDASLGTTIALVGSSGHLEVAVSQGNAAAQLGVGKGERVKVRAST
ncbi:MAG: SAM-dependent chlorinase/fluorinase, partial [Candidatus Eisenbacteria bacterium]|nr:SAM-dependent chlorinase/fluorinase [Candidatus Eisenbacteria bacterium]